MTSLILGIVAEEYSYRQTKAVIMGAPHEKSYYETQLNVPNKSELQILLESVGELDRNSEEISR